MTEIINLTSSVISVLHVSSPVLAQTPGAIVPDSASMSTAVVVVSSDQIDLESGVDINKQIASQIPRCCRSRPQVLLKLLLPH